jgi:hypothetical protein
MGKTNHTNMSGLVIEANTLLRPAVLVGTSKTLTVDDAGKVIFLDQAAGSKATLPAATGSGYEFKFVVKTVPTSNSHEIATDNVATLYGVMEVDKAGTVTNYTSAGTNKALKFLNDGTQGAHAVGDMIILIDVDVNKWAVQGFTQGTGTLATPFSSTV